MEAGEVKTHGSNDRVTAARNADRAPRTTAQIFAAVAGGVLVVLGVAALIVHLSFAVGDSITTQGLLFFDANGWLGLFMLLSGIVLLLGARSPAAARRNDTAVGMIYLIVTVWSLFTPSVIWLLPVNDPTAIVFAAIGLLGLTAGLGPDPKES